MNNKSIKALDIKAIEFLLKDLDCIKNTPKVALWESFSISEYLVEAVTNEALPEPLNREINDIIIQNKDDTLSMIIDISELLAETYHKKRYRTLPKKTALEWNFEITKELCKNTKDIMANKVFRKEIESKFASRK